MSGNTHSHTNFVPWANGLRDFSLAMLAANVPEEVEFDSDRDVIGYANTKLDGLDLEVWEGSRVVIRLKSRE